ncbi:MAG: inositol phosphorylceramide synthase [Candidatus Aminicenantes bacterium]|nr:inositol phosphorylceramide synthase [Candidatus Aminicenantes bacterium]
MNFRFGLKGRPVTAVTAALLALLGIFLVLNRFFYAPKILLIGIILIVSLALRKTGLLLRDWFPFLAFLYLFDSLRGTIYALTCRLQLPVRALYVLDLERTLFGTVPSEALQKALLRSPPPEFGLLEKIATVVHGTHFIAFLYVGLVVWLQRPRFFGAYKSAFSWLTGLGVLGYLLVPTVPPWMASEVFGLVPGLQHFNVILYNTNFPDLSAGFNTNPIAAMPSLHAAFPCLAFLILARLYRGRALVFGLYALLMALAIVYTSDHYVVDLLAGFALAAACYMFAFRRLAGSAPPPATRSPWRPAALGSALLAAGIGLGLANKHAFEAHPEAYDYASVPRYVDFTGNEDRYAGNFSVQMYLGGHAISRGDIGRALGYFERALGLAEGRAERARAELRIAQGRALLENRK